MLLLFGSYTFCIRSEFSQIQGALKLRLFFWNFQGLAYCLIFGFQGSVLSILSAATRSFYHIAFDLSTTFFIFFFLLLLSSFPGASVKAF